MEINENQLVLIVKLLYQQSDFPLVGLLISEAVLFEKKSIAFLLLTTGAQWY